MTIEDNPNPPLSQASTEPDRLVPLPRLLSTADLPLALDVQATAFQEDPLQAYLFPDPIRRATAARRIYRPFIAGALRRGQAYGVGEPLMGIAIWEAPGSSAVGPADFFRGGSVGLLFLLPAFLRAGPIFGRFEAMRKRHAPGPHYYLSTISVHPDAQGQGLASKLIRPFLARADALDVPTYTETMTPSNVPLYEYFGFDVVETAEASGPDLRQWAFLRRSQR